MNVSLKLANGKRPQWADLPFPLPLFFNYLWASVFYGLIVLARMFLFLAPGVIWAIQFWPYVYLLVNRKVSTLESISQASQLISGVKTQLLLFLLALLGINVIGAKNPVPGEERARAQAAAKSRLRF